MLTVSVLSVAFGTASVGCILHFPASHSHLLQGVFEFLLFPCSAFICCAGLVARSSEFFFSILRVLHPHGAASLHSFLLSRSRRESFLRGGAFILPCFSLFLRFLTDWRWFAFFTVIAHF